MDRITDSDIEDVLSVADYLGSCDEAFRLYITGELVSPARKEDVWRDGDSNIFRLEMPAVWEGRYRATKVIREQSSVAAGHLGDRSAALEIEDLRTGDVFMMDAEYITNMRTGAAGVLGARYLGPKEIRTVSIVGTGRIAKAIALCADEALRPQEIRCTSRKEENRTQFKNFLVDRIEARIEVADTIASCLKGADAVFTSVPTPRPILNEQDLPEGVHLTVIAGDPRTSQLFPELIQSREVVVDHIEQSKKSGDFLAVVKAGKRVRMAKDSKGNVLTIGDAATGRLEERRGKGLVAYFTGMALQDLHAGVTILRRLGLTHK
jgi:ornithine cyclodeaminase/alanine dehydrogenase-like protein (mu-crystallin family)